MDVLDAVTLLASCTNENKYVRKPLFLIKSGHGKKVSEGKV
jgi:hypothetical protein